jgi:hypothetical protein
MVNLFQGKTRHSTMARIIVFIFLSFLFKTSFGQTNIILTKSQMLEDYDFLLNKIEQISPHLEPKKELWNYDILQQIKNRRQEIDTITSYNSFWFLVSRALQTCQDGHTGIRTKNEAFEKIYDDFNIDLPFKYLNGEYTLIKPFTFNGQTFPIGTIATKFNGLNIHDYVQTTPQYRYFMQWDVLNKRFYYNSFFATDNIALTKEFSLTLKTQDQNNSIINFKTSDKVVIQKSEAIFSSSKKVEFWKEQKVLYIRVPVMDRDDIPFYKREILTQSKGKQIEKILIDIRNNLGGSDAVWQAIYETIIPTSISYEQKLCGNKPDFMTKDYLKEKGLKVEDIKSENISFLNNHKLYTYYLGTTTIKPSKKSILFKGKIIVIGNENIYSSAGSCMLLPNANPQDSIISIGRPTGRFLGGGYDPIVCTLPNSKIEFNIEPAIDMTNTKEAKDIMHDTYEITMPYSIKEFADKFNYSGNIWSKEYLIKYDPFIAKALRR